MSLLENLPLRYQAYSELWEAAAAQLGEDDDEMRDDILRFGALHCVKARIAIICETQGMPRGPDSFNVALTSLQCPAEHDGESLFRLSSSRIQAVLKAKVNTLIDPNDGIFGPLESVTLGSVAQPSPVAPDATSIAEDDDSESQETVVDAVPAAVPVNSPMTAPADKVFPTVSRGLGREGVGDGQGLSEELQFGEHSRCAP